jgi:flagellar basal-body rod protein FlgG
MQRALFTAASGMHAQETRMNVTANNIANASTTGFKRSRAEFEALLSERVRSADTPVDEGGTRPSALEVGLGVRTTATTRDFTQGDMISTGNPLDLVIEGRGFFRVERRDGELAYSRAGNLRIDGAGRLVSQSGDVLTPGIRIPDDAMEVAIAPNGVVSVRVPSRDVPVEVGRLEVALFPNPAGLHSLGDNMFSATGASGLPTMVRPGEEGSGALSQGFLEGSNVKPVEEMIALITTQRAYEMNSKVISAADEMMQKLGQIR